MPSFYIEQFGCRATQADGAALEVQLLQRGYTPAHKSAADIVVVNTCTVTAAADAQARDSIRKISAQNHAARVIVTGCYAQRAPEEVAQLPGVAWVVGNSHKPELPGIIENLFLSHASATRDFLPVRALQPPSLALPQPPPQILTGEFERKPLSGVPVFNADGNHTRPTLKIQDGCDSRCAYCVIPQVRGKSRSLPSETVLQQVNELCGAGVKEIVLSGINIGTYGRDLNSRITFSELLRRILSETPIERLRVSSIEPMDVTSDLTELFAANERMAPHFHIPLQSGADRILAAMHRWYRAEHYARRAHLIRENLPHAAIGADVIAGFPGETAEDHSTTLAFIESLPLTYLHVFSFSKRPGTQAAALPNEVPPAAIKNRARELRALGEKKSAAFRREQIGTQLRVLTLRAACGSPTQLANDEACDEKARANEAVHGKESSYTPALSSNYLRARLPGHWAANQWVNVRVAAVEGNDLIGEPAELFSPELTCSASA
ncbi:MAG TPA: tRNA (N(6)-L-threonylcarbamoyladenosine(37)-C(2))-methylthiotransferase MtaB [Candidatus Acidoferrum sp.]|jgi:threonylcarbamoyladenosine tRNA methylthiotransferase MtaB|nr:tRNA (N(6)-L-threonylcarbamoyladenosine(37)-C(2))-methylthiotransferase MtaB [Candidatus Acidoferrum sp.]